MIECGALRSALGFVDRAAASLPREAERLLCGGPEDSLRGSALGEGKRGAERGTFREDDAQSPHRSRETSTGSSLAPGSQNAPWPRGASPAQRSSTGSPFR